MPPTKDRLLRSRGEPYPRTQPPFAVVVAAKASILARSLPSRPGLPETTSRSSFGWFAGVKDRCTVTRPQSSTMSTRSFGHRERSGSALSLRGNQIAVDATSSLSRFPRGLARVPAGVQRRELREVERRELRDAVTPPPDSRPCWACTSSMSSSTGSRLGGALEAAQPMVNALRRHDGARFTG